MMSICITKKDRVRIGQVKESREVRFVAGRTREGRENAKIKDINKGIIQSNGNNKNLKTVRRQEAQTERNDEEGSGGPHHHQQDDPSHELYSLEKMETWSWD
jgi:hypothetical protein